VVQLTRGSAAVPSQAGQHLLLQEGGEPVKQARHLSGMPRTAVSPTAVRRASDAGAAAGFAGWGPRGTALQQQQQQQQQMSRMPAGLVLRMSWQPGGKSSSS